MPTTITDLAPETLARIFELGAVTDFLLATSLVCRAWRNESQARLWRTVFVYDLLNYDETEKVTRILNSPALGRYVTVKATFSMKHGLSFWDEGVPSGAVIAPLIQKLVGLKTLDISKAKNLPASLFLNRNLIGLSHLTISGSSFLDLGRATTLPFRLRTLDFSSGGTKPNAPILQKALFATSTLRKLKISLAGWPGEIEALVDSLPALSTSLQEITIAYRHRDPVPVAAFATLTSLRRVTLNQPDPRYLEQLLESIPSPLHFLRIEASHYHPFDPSFDIAEWHHDTIQLILHGLHGLQDPVLSWLEELELVDFPGGFGWLEELGLVAACAARGVELRCEETYLYQKFVKSSK